MNLGPSTEKPVQDNKPLGECRGMSEPFFFSFSVSPKHHILLCHGVIFTSYMKEGGEKIDLLQESDDPRAQALITYLWTNFLKERKKKFEKAYGAICQGLDDQLALYKKTLTEFDKAIDEYTKKLENHP